MATCVGCGGEFKTEYLKEDAEGKLFCRACLRPARPKAASGRGLAVLAAVLALLALFLAAGALALGLVVMRRSPFPGKGLAAYDFSTPEAAIRSAMQMQVSGDMRAQLELSEARRELDREKGEKAIASLHFERSFEHDGKVLVLYRFDEEDKTRYQWQWMEKGKDGRYATAVVQIWGWARERGEKGRIFKAVMEWQNKGRKAGAKK